MRDEKSSRLRGRVALILPIVLLVVFVLVVLGGTTHLFDSLFHSSVGSTATPTAFLAPGDDLFYIQVYPWGSVSVDGHALAQLPTPGNNQPLRLSRGEHHIMWQAAPFQPVVCTVFVPSQPGNSSCPYESEAAPTTGGRLLTFTASLSNLSTAQRSALLQQVQTALNEKQATDTVQPGEQYAFSSSVGSYSVKTATQPLRATLHFQVDVDPSSGRSCATAGDLCQSPDGQDCRQFCTFQALGLSSTAPGAALSSSVTSPNTWDIAAVAYAFWEYRTLDNHVVAQNQPDSLSNSSGTEHSVSLQAHWDGSTWHVTVISANVTMPTTLPCMSIQSELNNRRNPTTGSLYYGLTQGNPRIPITWHLFAAANPAQGCLAVATPQQSNASPSLTSGAFFLYRFGVLLAANAVAHQYFPNIPGTDGYEQGITQQTVGHIAS